MDRRKFIRYSGLTAGGVVLTPSLSGFAAQSRQDNNKIEKVHLLFKTHLDIGFTNLGQNVLQTYIKEFIPGALSLSESLRQQGQTDRYIWTTGSWLIYEFLEKATPSMRRRMEEAIGRGDINWHGLPFTTHSELADASLFDLGIQLSRRLDERFGKKTIAAKMTDVPGHTRGIVPVLAKNNIRFLHIGVNSASTPPDVPSLFVWKAPDDTELDVMYAKGYGNQLILPGTQVAVDIRFTNDNHGPHKPEAISNIYKELRNQFPNAQIQASTLNEIAGEVAKIHDRLPVVDQEIGDTWIHGIGSDPLKISQFRELSRLRTKWLGEKSLRFADDTDLAFGIPLLMVAEHTWGLDVKKYLRDWEIYEPEDFAAARAKPNFKLMEQSWQEKRAYLDKALLALPNGKQAEARASLERKAAENELSGFKPITDPEKNIHTHFFHLRIDPKNGSICRLKDKQSGYEWAGDKNPLALFSYQTFSKSDYDRFHDQYLVKKIRWAFEDFGKPGLENTNALSRSWMPRLQAAYHKKEAEGESVLLELALEDQEGKLKGLSPGKITVELYFPNKKKEVQVTLKWFAKPAVRLPEAYWLSFVPPVQKGDWIIEKMGQAVNFRDVVRNGARKLHATTGCVSLQGNEKYCAVTSLDAPLVAPAERNLLNFDNALPDVANGIHFCLFNNVWGTNFTMWFENDMQYRFTFGLEPSDKNELARV